jgi:hypothetical protein
MDHEEQEPRRPWKWRGDEEWHGDRSLEDRDFNAKRQQGMGANVGQGGMRKARWEERGSHYLTASARGVMVDKGNRPFTRGSWWI